MTTGLQINKYIKRWLQGDEELTALVQKKNIQPLVLAPTNFPFISFTHGDILPEYTKDGCAYDSIPVVVAIVADDYEKCVDIAQKVRELLECKTYRDDEIWIPEMTVEYADEEYLENTFVVHIVFNIEVHTL